MATLFYFLLCQPHLTFHSKDKGSALDQQKANLLSGADAALKPQWDLSTKIPHFLESRNNTIPETGGTRLNTQHRYRKIKMAGRDLTDF